MSTDDEMLDTLDRCIDCFEEVREVLKEVVTRLNGIAEKEHRRPVDPDDVVTA
jgi:histone H3/H4